MISITGKRSFRGGVHPAQKKWLSWDKPIRSVPVPDELVVLLRQHIGKDLCECRVAKGQGVRAGEAIGECAGFVCARVHSPVDGEVKETGLRSHPVLVRGEAVVIKAEAGIGPAEPSFKAADFDENKYSDAQILEAASEAGIVGMGGAGFPTSVKIAAGRDLREKKRIIVNGAECEPYITADYRVMVEWPEQVLAGIKLLRRATEFVEVDIAIEDNKPEAIAKMQEVLGEARNTEGIRVVSVKTKYPQGGERQLVQAILGKQVPAGGIPPMIGVLVFNVATVAAVADAVVYGRALTHRVVTVTGEGVANPGNYYVPVGMRVCDLIGFCGGLKGDAARVIMGGPMMGFAVADIETPITKTTGAITVLAEGQISRAKLEGRQTACIRCGRCLEACPEHLNPTKIAHAVRNNRLEVAEENYIRACTECGCCSYVCPANIELTGYIRTGKLTLARAKQEQAVEK